MAEGKIVISTDEMHATLVLADRGGFAWELNTVLSELEHHKIKEGIDQAAIEEALGTEVDDFPSAGVVIARGVEPVHGQDGRLDLKVESGSSTYQADQEADQVDYREAIQIESVKPGDLIGEIVEPVDGTPGRTVKGFPISEHKGKPIKYAVGANVEDRGGKFYATCEGILSTRDNVITISPVLDVPGDLDLSVGNVKFDGAVIIRGNVLDGFNIEAGGDVQIGGNVGASEITAKGDVEVIGGVNGNGKGKIFCEGDFTSKYVVQAHVTAHGNFNVLKEINNAEVRTLGEIKMGRGTIVGGRVVGLKKMYVGVTGSELGIKTTIEVGTHYQMSELEAAIVEYDGIFAEIEKKIAPYIKQPKKFEALAEERKQQLIDQRKTFESITEKWKEKQAQLQTFSEVLKARDTEIVVYRHLYSDTVVRSSHCVRTFTEAQKGAIRVREDVATGSMRVTQGAK